MHTFGCADIMMNDHIEVGSMYEIDFTNLPTMTSDQLRFIRVVMVSEKTESNVSVQFPSLDSLPTYLIYGMRTTCPALSETMVIGRNIAGKVLYRQVPSQEYEEKKFLESFWFHSMTSVLRNMIPKEGGYYLQGNSKGSMTVVLCPLKAKSKEDEEAEKGDEDAKSLKKRGLYCFTTDQMAKKVKREKQARAQF